MRFPPPDGANTSTGCQGGLRWEAARRGAGRCGSAPRPCQGVAVAREIWKDSRLGGGRFLPRTGLSLSRHPQGRKTGNMPTDVQVDWRKTEAQHVPSVGWLVGGITGPRAPAPPWAVQMANWEADRKRGLGLPAGEPRGSPGPPVRGRWKRLGLRKKNSIPGRQ